ncbi:MAG: selenocysteine-specific translation elongation factor [Planctomycetes bacterium]|nr:selenocysteine-specific translation elongation factor [Planctomycetota bacterium]
MEPKTPHLILGTAGHIDHGKTSLVRALTGIETDWLPEEKARGMTIDIGIAHLELTGGTLGVVDVPGHERFVRTMVAGASGIDLALLVVAADDGVMPQTREHLEIVGLLGVPHAVVALNKADLVDPAQLGAVEQEIRALLRPGAFAAAPIVPVSAVTGEGLPALRRALEEAVARAESRRRAAFFRLPIDRIFSIPGRGTVVTGSMLGGAVHVGDRVELLPSRQELRVRGLQTHNRDIQGLVSGQRTAVNLVGLKKEDVHRGMELAAPGYLTPTHCLDVEASCLSSAPAAGLRSFVRVRLGLGTSEVLGRLVILEGKHLSPGGGALCQLRLHEPVVAEFGQRFILRDETAARTVGGGRVLRPVARRISLGRAPAECQTLRRIAGADEAGRIDQVLADAGTDWTPETAVAARAGATIEVVRQAIAALLKRGVLVRVPGLDYAVHTGALDALGERVCRFVKRYHASNPQLVGVDPGLLDRTFQRAAPAAVLEAALARLKQRGALVSKLDRMVALSTFQVEMGAGRRKLWERIRQELLDGGFKPPTADGLVALIGTRPTAIKEILQHAEAQGDVVQVDKGVFIPAETIQRLKDKMREFEAAHGPFSVSAIREYVESTRRYMVPLCEYLDRTGFTCRQGDLRTVVDGA